jgi:hypothetical protein
MVRIRVESESVAKVAVVGRPAAGCDGGIRPIPVSAACANDPTDADLVRPPRRWQPEARLAGAILAQALLDLQRCHPSSPLGQETRAWVEDDDQTWPMAFRPICDILGLDPDYVRAGVLGARRLTAAERPWLHAIGRTRHVAFRHTR